MWLRMAILEKPLGDLPKFRGIEMKLAIQIIGKVTPVALESVNLFYELKILFHVSVSKRNFFNKLFISAATMNFSKIASFGLVKTYSKLKKYHSEKSKVKKWSKNYSRNTYPENGKIPLQC